MESSAPAPARGWHALLTDGLLVLLLFGLTFKLTYNISAARDLGICDEATYMLLGARIPEHGLPPAEACPLYALWYLGLSWLEPDRVRLYYLSWSVLVALLAAGFFLLVRGLGGRRPAALAAAFLLLTSSLVDIHPYPSHLATLILVLGCALAVRLRPLSLSVAVLGVSLLLAGYARPEYFVSFLLFCVGGLVALWRCPRRWPVLGGCALLLLPAVLLVRMSGVPLGGSRSFVAFGQHYAHNVSIHRGGGVNPMLHWEDIVRADFGDARSFGEALRSNPRAVLWHVGANARSLPQSLALATAPNLNVSPQMSRALGLGMLAAVLLGVVGICRRWRSSRQTGEARGLYLGLSLLALVLIPAGASCLLVFPRQHYLMPGVTLTLALAASSLPRWEAWSARLGSRTGLASLAAILVLLTPNRAGRPWDLPTWLRHRPIAVPVLSEQRTVAVLGALRINAPIVLLDSSFYSHALYAGVSAQLVVPIADKREAFGDFLRRTGVNVVVLDPILRGDALYRDDPEFRAFAAGRHTDGFTRFDVPGCPVCIAVRDAVLSHQVQASRP